MQLLHEDNVSMLCICVCVLWHAYTVIVVACSVALSLHVCLVLYAPHVYLYVLSCSGMQNEFQ